MKLIPVLDLMHGQAVHARGGDRAQYRPIESPLCPGTAAPLPLARALLQAAGGDTLYIADLDALQGGDVQVDAIRALLAALPALQLWLDAGFATAAAATDVLQALGPHAACVTPVWASEALPDTATATAALADREQAVLSLDRRGTQTWDAAGLWQRPDLWPRRVIVMTLDRVGTHHGPDWATLAAVQAKAPGVELIGAGGLRDAADVAQAEAAGIRAWLVATALHEGRLGGRVDPSG
jgi:uncharacterized protein related to proFAR isomerase